MLKRILAFSIDIYLGSLLATLPISLASMYFLGEMTQNVFLLDKTVAIGMIVLSFAILFLYYLVVPWKLFKGQTIGKRLVGIRICFNDDQALFKRQFLMMLTMTSLTKLVIQLVGIISGYNFVDVFIDLARSAAFVSLMLIVFTKNRRSIHDMISGTFVK